MKKPKFIQVGLYESFRLLPRESLLFEPCGSLSSSTTFWRSSFVINAEGHELTLLMQAHISPSSLKFIWRWGTLRFSRHLMKLIVPPPSTTNFWYASDSIRVNASCFLSFRDVITLPPETGILSSCFFQSLLSAVAFVSKVEGLFGDVVLTRLIWR